MLKRFIFTKFALRANFILALCITGCASPEYRDSVIGKPADFQKVEPSNVLILDDPAKYTIEVGVFKTKVEVGLMPGIYTAEYKNGEGTFYHGDNPSVFFVQKNRKGVASMSDGGAWVPADPKVLPRFYQIISSLTVTNADELDAMISERKKDLPLTDLTSGYSDGLELFLRVRQQDRITQNTDSVAAIAGDALGSTLVHWIAGLDNGKIRLRKDHNDPNFAALVRNSLKSLKQ